MRLGRMAVFERTPRVYDAFDVRQYEYRLVQCPSVAMALTFPDHAVGGLSVRLGAGRPVSCHVIKPESHVSDTRYYPGECVFWLDARHPELNIYAFEAVTLRAAERELPDSIMRLNKLLSRNTFELKDVLIERKRQ